MDADQAVSGPTQEPDANIPLTGLAPMDSQHRRILQAMQLLLKSLETPFPEESLEVRVRRVRDLVNEHFAAEEQIMEAAGYPFLEAHRAEHQVLTERCDALMAGCGTTYGPTVAALGTTVLALFRHHVERVDRDYATYLGSLPAGPQG